MGNFNLKKFFSALSAAAVAASLSFQTLLPAVNAVSPDKAEAISEQLIEHEHSCDDHCCDLYDEHDLCDEISTDRVVSYIDAGTLISEQFDSISSELNTFAAGINSAFAVPSGLISDNSVVKSSSCSHQFNGSYTTTKQPTCTQAGEKAAKCTKCGKVLNTYKIDPLGHSWGNWSTTKNATCTVDGVKSHTCSRCKTTEKETIKATGHNFNGSFETTKQPTCTEYGEKVAKCTKCGQVLDTYKIDPKGHSYDSWVTVTAATCTKDGSRKHTCKTCGHTETQKISATGHNFNGSFDTIKQPTCTEPGEKVAKCTKCGEVIDTYKIDPKGHSYDSWVTVTAATCTKEGSRKHTCKTCGHVETGKISATGHNFNGSFDTIKQPTCTEAGEKVGRCTKCSEIITRTSIPATGHKYGSVVVLQNATCTSNGGGYCKCTKCNNIKSVTIPKKGHSFNGSFETLKEPTCTEDGEKVGRCTKCGQIVTRVAIPKLGSTGHKFNGSFERIEPTCTKEGHIIGRCTICGAVVSDNVIPKLSATGHTFNGSYVTVKEATCTSTGLKEGRCTRCGEVVSKAVIPKKAHKFEYVTAVPATSTQPGLEKEVCSVCGFESGNTRLLNPGDMTFEDCGYDKFWFCANGEFDDFQSWPLIYTPEEGGKSYLKLSFTTNNNWTVTAANNYVHIYDTNLTACSSGSKGTNDIVIGMDPFPYDSDAYDRTSSITISSGGFSKTYTLSQCNRTINGYTREYYVTTPAITNLLSNISPNPNAVKALKGETCTNGEIIIYPVDDYRYIAIRTYENETSNIEVEYIFFKAAAPSLGNTINAMITVLNTNGMKLVQNSNPLFKSYATISGNYANVTDEDYEHKVAVGETWTSVVSTGVGFGLGFVPGLGPIASFLVGTIVDTAINVTGNVIINCTTEDRGNEGIATATEFRLHDGCTLSNANDNIEIYCNSSHATNTSVNIYFNIVAPDGTSAAFSR